MVRSLLTLFLAAGLLAGGFGSAADETYTLKLYKSKKGDKTENEKVESSKSTAAFNVMGKAQKQEMAGGMKEAFTEEILEQKDGAPKATKLTRTYSVAEKTEKGSTTKAAYAGETVLIEKKGDKYEISVKGKALTEKDAPDLIKSFNKKDDEPQTEDFLPKDPVKVGEGWKLPADKSEKIFKSFGQEQMKIDAKSSTITGKLLKAYKKGGAQFGVLELTVTVNITEVKLGTEFVKTKPGSKTVIKGTIDTCIDGTVNSEDGKTEVTLDLSADLPNEGSITITGTTTDTQKQHASKK